MYAMAEKGKLEMRYTTFGRATGLRVSRFALGTANFGTAWGGGAEETESRAMFERFAEAGGTFIDTADVYSDGDSERMLAKFIGADREHFVLATKYGLSTGDVKISTTGNNRKNMVQALEGSLRRLGTSYVDLLWVHWPDPLTPTDEIMAGLNDLVRTGKVLYVGLSNFPAWQAARAATLAELRGWAPLTALQFEYSLVERSAERDLLPMADAFGLGVSTWSPLGGGLLTGKYRQGATGRLQDWNGGVVQKEDTRQKSETVDTVLAIADETGLSPAQVSLAWLLGRQPTGAAPRVPIIGPRSVEHLEAYLQSLDVELTAEQTDRLCLASAPVLGVPHDGVANAASTLVGGSFEAVHLPPLPVR
ncbi:aldo/keto reductase [Kitasatospora kazusensis]|uniref:Aldo/keto reductase n=1 Tax=Kitasatospora kazusensis TaxID=407974 RepID=A0ABP5M157_9ACTN